MDEQEVKAFTEREWKEKLDADQYNVLRRRGTEYPGTGKYDKFFENGLYKCAGCGLELFKSDEKYDAGSGWPSFKKPMHPENVGFREDYSHHMYRTEVICKRCGGHLGHVWQDDMPEDKAGYYCINSAALDFQKDKKE